MISHVGEGNGHKPIGTKPKIPQSETEQEILTVGENRVRSSRGGRKKKKPKLKSNKVEDKGKKGQSNRGEDNTDDTHGISLNQILTYGFGNRSGREDKP